MGDRRTTGRGEVITNDGSTAFDADQSLGEFVNVGGTGTIRAAVTVHGKARHGDMQ